MKFQFLISVLLVIMSGLNMIGQLEEHNDYFSLTSEKAGLIGKVKSNSLAVSLYRKFIACSQEKLVEECASQVNKAADKISNDLIGLALKRLVVIEQSEYYQHKFPTLTLSLVGFTTASLYCFFIILSIERASRRA